MDAKAIALDFIKGLRHSAEPAKLALANEETVRLFLREFGWDASITAADLPEIRNRWGFEAVFNSLSILTAALEADDLNETQLIADSLAAIAQLGNMLQTINGSGAGVAFPFDQSTFWNEVPRELMDRLGVRWNPAA